MLSRVADSIYWLNRYIERAENNARFVDVNLNLLLDLPPKVPQQWEPLVVTTGDSDFFAQHYGEASAENIIQFLTFDENYANSILNCATKARENARSIREIISSEMWEEVNDFYLMVKETAQQNISRELPNFLTQVKLASHRFAGVMEATMTHNEGWHFGKMGRLLERADKTARLLDVKYFFLLPSVEWVGTPLDQIQWIALLRSASAYEMYRKCDHRITPSAVARFLILNREFPRSIHFCLRQVEQSLHAITGIPIGTWSNPAERTLGKLCSQLSYLTVEDIINQGLHEFLGQLRRELNRVGDDISEAFFGLRPPQEESDRQILVNN